MSERQSQHSQAGGGSSGNTRRNLIFGGVGLAALLGGGWILLGFGQEETGPAEVAEDFIEEIDDSDFSSANDLIHPSSPLDGAGTAADLILTIGAPGADQAIDIIDISVARTEILQQSDTEADVEVTVEIDLLLDEPSANIPFNMRTNEGDWHVWNIET